jgi:hypothetical protein
MGIALSLQEYLNDHHINYEVMTHERTGSSLQTALPRRPCVRG